LFIAWFLAASELAGVDQGSLCEFVTHRRLPPL
jgi:hypothetical protein